MLTSHDEPFLLAFFESRVVSDAGSLGTETFTKTFGESSDTDVDAELAIPVDQSVSEADTQPRAALLGTETHTLQRIEDQDNDLGHDGSPLWEGSIL